jgi:hypothetical protein
MACTPFVLPVDDSGSPTCQIGSVETVNADCSCSAPGLAPASAELTQATRSKLLIDGVCGLPGGLQTSCADLCVCAVPPATGASLQQCLTEATPDPNSSGWCYLSADQGAPASSLLSVCMERQTHAVRFVGDAIPKSGTIAVLSCDTGNLPSGPAAALGEVCVSNGETFPDYAGGSDANDVAVDNHAPACASQICVQNHFQGRASCPYGQSAPFGGCLVASSDVPVSVPVKPQLTQRPAAVASICSCQCAGEGPGPYCTCPSDMECDHLLDKIGVLPAGEPDLSGSYCIPSGSLYDRNETAVCASSNCGDAHPY